jgi:hypothetical protein
MNGDVTFFGYIDNCDVITLQQLTSRSMGCEMMQRTHLENVFSKLKCPFPLCSNGIQLSPVSYPQFHPQLVTFNIAQKSIITAFMRSFQMCLM